MRLLAEEMPAQEAKRKNRTRRFDVLIVPDGDGRAPYRFRAGWWKLGLLSAAVFFACVGFTLAVLIFTPVVMYLPIPNPALEAKYGRQLTETQQKLTALVEDVSLLRDYNQQLRKALGQSESAKPVVDQKAQTTPPPVVAQNARAREDFEQMDQLSGGDTQVATGEQVVAHIPAGRAVGAAQLPLIQPATGFISQGFDPSRHHLGMDIAAKQGTPVSAATDGYVVYAGWTYEDGNLLILSHGSGYLTVYKHTLMILKTIGTSVRRGEVIALLGSSGRTSLGPHLHFEVWKDGVPQDPATFLLTRAKVQ
jgi:murein DD-endopeptidase MepM/ murein hydrolase activator NlpD